MKCFLSSVYFTFMNLVFNVRPCAEIWVGMRSGGRDGQLYGSPLPIRRLANCSFRCCLIYLLTCWWATLCCRCSSNRLLCLFKPSLIYIHISVRNRRESDPVCTAFLTGSSVGHNIPMCSYKITGYSI